MGYRIIRMRHKNAGNFTISIPESEVERMKLQGWEIDDDQDSDDEKEDTD